MEVSPREGLEPVPPPLSPCPFIITEEAVNPLRK